MLKRSSLLFLALFALPLGAAELPPLNSPATEAIYPGKLVWADLFASDPAAAERFYAGLFNWTSTEVERQTSSGTHSYLVMSNDGRPVAGIALRPKKLQQEMRDRWIGYISVQDVSAALATVKNLGGHAIFPMKDLPQRGTQAIFADGEGAMLGMIHSSSGDPGEYAPANGDWTWAEHFARNPSAALSFDQSVFGYETAPDDRTHQANTFLLSSGGYARASVAPLPAKAGAHPAWLLYVRVFDLGAAVAKAAALGGEVRVKPRRIDANAKLAVVRDPGGAAIGLVELSDDAQTPPPAPSASTQP